MARNPWQNQFDDYDDYSDYEAENPEGNDTITCRGCGRQIYEDAFQCPYCGQYVEADTSPWSDRPFWWIVLAILGLLAVISALLLNV